MKLLLLVLVFQFFSFGYTSSIPLNEDNNLKSKKLEFFLPNHTIPNHYDIKLNLSIGPDFYYNGFVAINLTILKNTNTITLHADKEKITRAYLIQGGKKIIKVVKININLDNTFLTLVFRKEIKPGNYVLKINFKAKYYGGAGLMLSWYETKNGTQPMLATHFEPVYARRMFVCFDEPRLKATFQMEIINPKQYNATSNTEIESIKTIGNYTVTRFKKTPPMSTYLLALSVSEFKSYEMELDKIKFHILVPSEVLEDSKFALNITKESVKVFQNILNVNYSLPKLDSVTVPTFGGGMENWGLIVYGKMILDIKSESSIQSVTELICHEVAHQWFGNLVTCEWWDFSWLNEGFATHYAPLCADTILGNNSTRRFMYEHVARMRYVLKEDSTNVTKSLDYHVEHPYMTWLKFTNIDYQKGSAIVRFMSIFIQNFNDGITKYLKKLSYTTANPNQLFEILNEKANLPIGVNVTTVMKNWVENPGYPLLTINVTRHGKGASIEFKQERFYMNSNISSTNEKWWIPITLAFGDSPHTEDIYVYDWIRPNNQSFILNIEDLKSNWLIGNIQAAVYCRVNYDLDNWNNIIEFLKSSDYEKIHVLNRARLIDDANNLVIAQKLPQTVLLNLLSYLKQESDPIVKNIGESILANYAELLKDTDIYPKYVKFVNDICDNTSYILNEPNFEKLINNIIVTPGNSLQLAQNAFDNITNKIFSDKNYRKVKSLLHSIGRSAQSAKEMKFAAKLDETYELNKIMKNNFWNGNNYNKMRKWLKEKY